MIGYMVEQELGNLLPFEKPIATLLTMVEIDPDDPAFDNPTKFVGPCYHHIAAERYASERGWVFKQDGDAWRRVVASPEPKRIFELDPIIWLLEKGAVVICTGGGGIPTAYLPDGTRTLVGVEAVIDKDLASELLAQLHRGRPVRHGDRRRRASSATGGPRSRRSWGTSPRRSSGATRSPRGRWVPRSMPPRGSSRPPGKRAAIGCLSDIVRIVAGEAGTNVVAEHSTGEPS